jgi:flagellar biosynthesis protein FlhF
MRLKTYTADSMAAALAEVKRDLGADAVILHTRVYRTGAVMGLGGRKMVEITASDQAAAIAPRKKTVIPAHRNPQIEVKKSSFTGVGAPTSCPPLTEQQGSGVQGVAVATVSEPDAIAALREDLSAIRRLIGEALLGRLTAPGAALPGALGALYARLREDGLAPDIADALASAVRDELSAAELADAAAARRAILRHLERLIPCAGRMTPAGPQADARPLVIALVGPTGVGKTTTIAKLAAAYKLRHAKRVGLVTCDTYRIAAVEQLRVYASIIDVPLKVALTADEVRQSCHDLHDCDVILLDTPGRSHHDSPRLDELAGCLRAANPHEVHLVLSAAASENVLARAATQFGRIGPNRLILSKLDECEQFAPAVNLVRRTRLAVSYCTTGQEVPDQIELATPQRLASLVLDGRAVLAGPSKGRE